MSPSHPLPHGRPPSPRANEAPAGRAAPATAALTSERGLSPLARGQLQVLGHGWGAHGCYRRGMPLVSDSEGLSKPRPRHTEHAAGWAVEGAA